MNDWKRDKYKYTYGQFKDDKLRLYALLGREFKHCIFAIVLLLRTS